MKSKFTIIVIVLVLIIIIVSIMIMWKSCQKKGRVSSSETDETTLHSDILDAFVDNSITFDMLRDYTGITFPEESEIECAVRYILKNKPHYYVLEGMIMVKINVPYESKTLLYETLKNAADLTNKISPDEKIFAGLPHESDKTYGQADRRYTGMTHIHSEDADEYQIISFDIVTVEDENENVISVYLTASETLLR